MPEDEEEEEGGEASDLGVEKRESALVLIKWGEDLGPSSSASGSKMTCSALLLSLAGREEKVIESTESRRCGSLKGSAVRAAISGASPGRRDVEYERGGNTGGCDMV